MIFDLASFSKDILAFMLRMNSKCIRSEAKKQSRKLLQSFRKHKSVVMAGIGGSSRIPDRL